MKRKEWLIVLGVVVVVAIAASLITSNLTGNVINIEKTNSQINKCTSDCYQKQCLTFAAKDRVSCRARCSSSCRTSTEVYTKDEIDSIVSKFDGDIAKMVTFINEKISESSIESCDTTGKIVIGLSQINNYIVGNSGMDNCDLICASRGKKCLIGFVGKETKSTEMHTMIGSLDCRGSRGTLTGLSNETIECVCCGGIPK